VSQAGKGNNWAPLGLCMLSATWSEEWGKEKENITLPLGESELL
jgi:hypothetical protein